MCARPADRGEKELTIAAGVPADWERRAHAMTVFAWRGEKREQGVQPATGREKKKKGQHLRPTEKGRNFRNRKKDR